MKSMELLVKELIIRTMNTVYMSIDIKDLKTWADGMATFTIDGVRYQFDGKEVVRM